MTIRGNEDWIGSLGMYLEFLPEEGARVIAQLRHEAQEPVSILSGIHWVAHHPDVPSKLARLIIVELNKVLNKLSSSNYSTLPFKTMAALTLAPDKCYEECFGDWEDYHQIEAMIPLLEMKMGRRIMIRPHPETNLYRPILWKRLQSDSFRRKAKKLMQ